MKSKRIWRRNMRNTKINMKKQTKSAEIVTNKEEKD